MEQVAVVKNLRIVPLPIMECASAVPSATNLPFRQFIPVSEQWGVLHRTIELSLDSALQEQEKKRDTAVGTAEKSPLLALAGTVECDLAAIEPAPVAELRVVPQDPELAKHATTPLLALAGTLECNVPDFGKRHDEYIGDALIAELRGNEDD